MYSNSKTTTLDITQKGLRVLGILSVSLIFNTVSLRTDALAASATSSVSPSLPTLQNEPNNAPVGLVQNAQIAIPSDLLRSDGRVVRMGGHIVMPISGAVSLSLDNQGAIRVSIRQAQMRDLIQSGGVLANEQGGVVLTTQGRDQLMDVCCVNTRDVPVANVASMVNGVFTLGYDSMVATKPRQYIEPRDLTQQALRTK
jgi:hypothetical protein